MDRLVAMPDRDHSRVGDGDGGPARESFERMRLKARGADSPNAASTGWSGMIRTSRPENRRKAKAGAPEGIRTPSLCLRSEYQQATLFDARPSKCERKCLVAPPLPAIVGRLCRAILRWHIPPPQPIAIDKDNPVQNAPIINTFAIVALREIGLKTYYLLAGQPGQITHHPNSSP